MKECNEKAACMGRREFLVKAGFVAGGAVLTVSALGGTAFGATFEDVTIDVAADGPLAKVGGYEIVDSSAGKLIVIHEDADKYAAFSAKCTHKGALLDYDAIGKKLICKKHGSAFDETSGAVLRGPAEDPLKSYSVKSADKKVVISIPS